MVPYKPLRTWVDFTIPYGPMGVSKNGTPKSSHLFIGFGFPFLKTHPFWGVKSPYFWVNLHMEIVGVDRPFRKSTTCHLFTYHPGKLP